MEAHTEREVSIALDCGATLIGVNNRNLHTFQLDLETTANAIQVIHKRGLTWNFPGSTGSGAGTGAGTDGGAEAYPDVTVLSLSGVSSKQDVSYFRNLGVSGVLVGT